MYILQKRILALAAALLCFTSLSLMAQDSLLGRMEQLRERYGVHFIYDASLQGTLTSSRTESAPAVTLPLEEALRQTFVGTAVNWQLHGNSVILKAAPAPVRVRRFAISGHITDAETGETLIGAGVLSGRTGAVTNEFGFYSLPLPAGRHQLQVAYIGYEQAVLELDLQRDTVLNFSLRNTEELDAARTPACSPSTSVRWKCRCSRSATPPSCSAKPTSSNPCRRCPASRAARKASPDSMSAAAGPRKTW